MGNFQAALMGVVYDATEQDVWEIAHFRPKMKMKCRIYWIELGMGAFNFERVES